MTSGGTPASIPRLFGNGSVLRRRIPFSGAALLWALASYLVAVEPISAAVIGADDRRGLDPSWYSVDRKIGRLVDQKSNSQCTAFCVESDVIATASHCLYPQDAGVRTNAVADTVFQLDGQTSVIAGSRSPVPAITSGTMTLNLRPPIEAARDWALVKLANPICRSGGLTLSSKSAAELEQTPNQTQLFQAGYHRDHDSGRITLSGPCSVAKSFRHADAAIVAAEFGDPDHVLLHSCDTGPASSGSPILIQGTNGPEVVGINSGTYVRTRVTIRSSSLSSQRYRSDVIANTGVSVLAFGDRIGDLTAGLIETRSQMRTLQTLLAAEGWYSGPRDGFFGPESRAAIEMFERLTGQPVKGLATVGIMEKLGERAANRAPVETGSVNHKRR